MVPGARKGAGVLVVGAVYARCFRTERARDCPLHLGIEKGKDRFEVDRAVPCAIGRQLKQQNHRGNA